MRRTAPSWAVLDRPAAALTDHPIAIGRWAIGVDAVSFDIAVENLI